MSIFYIPQQYCENKDPLTEHTVTVTCGLSSRWSRREAPQSQSCQAVEYLLGAVFQTNIRIGTRRTTSQGEKAQSE